MNAGSPKQTILYPGRFQPLHNGHAEIVRYLSGKFDRVIVSVSQSHISHTNHDPLSGGERYEMIRRFALSEKLNNVEIIPVPYESLLSTWVGFIESICPPFDVVYARNPLIRTIFRDAGYPIEDFGHKRTCSATKVRAAIAGGMEWRSLVPPSTAAFMEERPRIQRIHELGIDKNV